MNSTLVSFDLWDTVLRRDCHPEAIKLEVARHLAGLPGMRSNARSLYLRRLHVESVLGKEAAARGHDPDSNFVEVHRRLLQSELRCQPTEMQLRAVLQKEVEIEIAHTYVDSTALQLLETFRRNASRVVYISDFYMPKSWLEQILAENNVLSYFDAGYVSIDLGHTKHAGHLFEKVRVLEGVAQDAPWTHYGDNAVSDVLQAQKNGINGIHFLPQAEHLLRKSKEKAFNEKEGITRWENFKLRLMNRKARV